MTLQTLLGSCLEIEERAKLCSPLIEKQITLSFPRILGHYSQVLLRGGYLEILSPYARDWAPDSVSPQHTLSMMIGLRLCSCLRSEVFSSPNPRWAVSHHSLNLSDTGRWWVMVPGPRAFRITSRLGFCSSSPYLPINVLKLCLNLSCLSVSHQWGRWAKSFLSSPQGLIPKYQKC